MQSLAEYIEKIKSPTEPGAPDLSGIECPDCELELRWAEKSLFCTHPPMKRLICPCGFSQVVEVRE